MKLFGVDIAKEIASGMAGGLLPAQLVRSTPGTRDPLDPTAGTAPSTSTFSCRGFLDEYADDQFDGTSVLRGDRKALLLGGTLPASVAPQPGDRVKIEGRTFSIVNVQRDPAAATYVCQARGA